MQYACRKTLADRRVRVRGRFARNNDLCEDEITMKKNENITHKQDLYGGDHDSIQFQVIIFYGMCLYNTQTKHLIPCVCVCVLHWY